MPFDPDFEHRARECIHTARYEGLPEFAALMEAHVNAWRRYTAFDDALDASLRGWNRWYWRIVSVCAVLFVVLWLMHLHGPAWVWLANAYWAYLSVVMLRIITGYAWRYWLRHCELRAWHALMDYQRKLP